MQEFLEMGGYGAYVWPSYGITALVMVILLIASVRSLSSTEATHKRLQTELGLDKEQKQETENSNGDEA